MDEMTKVLTETINGAASAVENLARHQEQCDMDGVMVKVSRQALDEVLGAIDFINSALRLAAQSAAPVGEQHPSLETRIRAKTRIPLIKIAAECHRSKWQFSTNEETRLPAAEARRLVVRAFDVLHSMGDMAHKAAENLLSEKEDAAPPPSTPQVRELLKECQELLADLINPRRADDTSSLHFWSRATELECKARTALSANPGEPQCP